MHGTVPEAGLNPLKLQIWLFGARRKALFLSLTTLIVTLSGCHRTPKLPTPNSREYAQAVSDFYVGLAALQVGHDIYAEKKLSELTQVVPGEPAGWADWGVLALRQRNFDAAFQRLERARDLAPDNDQIYDLLGVLESQRGRSAEAIGDLRKAVELNPQNLRAIYQLAEEIERQGDPDSEIEFQQLMQKILAAQPNNLAALLELSRVAAKRGEVSTLKSAIAEVGAKSSSWPPEVQRQLANVQAAIASSDLRIAATQTTFLRNVLMRVPEYRLSLTAIKAAAGEEAAPITHFLKLESPAFKSAPADAGLTFDSQVVANEDKRRWNWVGAIPLGSEGSPVMAEANGRGSAACERGEISVPRRANENPAAGGGDCAARFQLRLQERIWCWPGRAACGSCGRIVQARFTDVTAETKLPKAVINGSYTGAWAVDIEADGDLDIVLGASEGVPKVLRNNGDGTFKEIDPFAGISGLRGFAWADLDGDGNPDAAIIDGAGKLHIFINERQGQFRERALPANLPSVKAIAVADADQRRRVGSAGRGIGRRDHSDLR